MDIFQFLMNRLIDQITGLLSSNEKNVSQSPKTGYANRSYIKHMKALLYFVTVAALRSL